MILQYVREICQFDLTCPIKGVGPGVVRKLLLEDSLKIRGRKDSKVGKSPTPGTLKSLFFTSEYLFLSSLSHAVISWRWWLCSSPMSS